MKPLIPIAVLALAAVPLVAAINPQDPPSSPEEAEMMAKWMEFMTPGEPHELIAGKAGKWNLVVTMWMTPDAPPSESTATSKHEMIMGGRYLLDQTRGDFMGQTFEGMGLTGYDNMKKKFFGMWIDNMGTGLMTSEGTYDKAKNAITYTGESPDVMSGGYKPMKTIETFVDDDHWTMEMHSTGPDGKMFKGMEIKYTRVK